MKKIFIGTGIITLFVFSFCLAPQVFGETIVSSKNLLRTVDVLGISLVRAGSIKLHVVDIADLTSPEEVELPTLTGNDGLIYIVKTFDSSNEATYSVNVLPSTGDKIEGIEDLEWGFPFGQGLSVTFVADETNETWWVVNISEIDSF